jgi:isorenieratene synthase
MMKDYFLGWTPTLRATFTGLGVNLLAAPADKIPLSAMIAAIRFYTMLRRDTWRLEYFPSNTHDCLIQPLIDRIEALDGMVMLGTEVDRLQRVDGSWKISVEDSRSGGRRSLIAEHIVMAVDPASSRRILQTSPDTAEIASTIRFPETLRNTVVRLWFDRSPRDGSPGGMLTGDLVPDNFFWFHRLYDEFREWHDVTGGSAIELHIYGSDELLDQPEQNLVILSVAEVQRAFPELRGHFVHGVIRENIQTHTCFVVPTAESLHVETPWPGIFACGDWVGYPTPALWMERASVTGIAAANNVLQASGIELYPIVAPPSPELPVRILAIIIRFFRFLLGPAMGWLMRRLRRNKTTYSTRA